MANKAIPKKAQNKTTSLKKNADANAKKTKRPYEKVPVRRDLDIERLPAEYEQALYDYIDEYLDSMKEDAARYEKKATALAAYQQERSTVPINGGYTKSRVLKIDFSENSIVPLMEIADLNYCDLFNKAFAGLIREKREGSGFAVVPPPKLQPDEEELQNICDFLADDVFTRIQELALKMSPPFWSTIEAQSWTPTKRVWEILDRQLPLRARGPMFPIELRTPSMMRAIGDKHRRTRVPLEDIPAIAEYFHISFHWLLMGSDQISATAKKPRTERILTAYKFMSASAKSDFLETVKYIAEQYSAREEG